MLGGSRLGNNTYILGCFGEGNGWLVVTLTRIASGISLATEDQSLQSNSR